jgi:hypothetical protein
MRKKDRNIALYLSLAEGRLVTGVHSMLARNIAATVLVFALGQAAFADDATTNMSSTPSTQTNTDSLPQELRQKLQQAGYKNIEIVPGSYLVNAQDNQGNHVMMRIGPSSMTVLTEASPGSSTTGNNTSTNTPNQNPPLGNSSSGDTSGANVSNPK